MPEILHDNRIISFKTNKPELVTDIIPEVNTIYKAGKLYIPYTLDIIKVLINNGFNMLPWAKILHTYSFPKFDMTHELYWWQLETAAFLTSHRRAFCLNEPRTGKTGASLSAADYLIQEGKAKSFLIITPRSCMESVWLDQGQSLIPHRPIAVIKGVKQKRLDTLDKPADIYVMNPDAMARIPELKDKVLRMVRAGKITGVILDESTEYGTWGTHRTKSVEELFAGVEYLWPLTGTPGEPMTVYGQARLFNPNSVPDCPEVWRRMTMYPSQRFTVGRGRKAKEIVKWLPNDKADSHIKRVLHPAIRIKASQVLDFLPELRHIPLRVPMSHEQDLIYNALKNDGRVIVQGHDIAPSNAAVCALKCAQVVAGGLMVEGAPDDQSVIKIPMADKIDTVIRLVSQTKFKTLIYSNFKFSIDNMVEALRKAGISAEKVNGDVNDTTRTAHFRKFMTDDELRVLVCHYETVSYGLELAKADQVIWLGTPRCSAVKYSQANLRLMSGKQESKLPTIYQMYSTPEELRGFKLLDDGVDWESQVSDQFMIPDRKPGKTITVNLKN